MDNTAAVIGLVIGLAAGCLAGRCLEKAQKGPILPPETQIDTVYRVDTFVAEKPVPKYITVVDSLYVPVYTPEWVHDTITVALPKERKVYSDSTYRAVVSGYRPSLDEIEVYQRTVEITKTVTLPPKKWSFAVGAGPGVIYSPFNNSIDAGVGVFGGITYRF